MEAAKKEMPAKDSTGKKLTEQEIIAVSLKNFLLNINYFTKRVIKWSKEIIV